jgi:MFS family permease
MSFRKYKTVLAIPRVLPATLFMFVAGLPLTIMTLTLSLHVLNEMGRSYFDAGLVATATALGFAVGSPLLGRMMDRHGLRPVVAVCGALSTIAWVLLPLVNYTLFVALAFAAGVFTIPTGSLSRQFVASLVPEDQRRPADGALFCHHACCRHSVDNGLFGYRGAGGYRDLARAVVRGALPVELADPQSR